MARSTAASAATELRRSRRARFSAGLMVAALAVIAAVLTPGSAAEAQPRGEAKPDSYRIAITDSGVTGIPDRWFSWDWAGGAGFEVRTAILENQTSAATAVSVTIAAPETVAGDPRVDGSYYCWDSAACQSFAELSSHRATVVDAVVLEPGESYEYTLAFGHLVRHPNLSADLPSLTVVDMAVTSAPVIAETAAAASWMGSIVDGIAGWFRADR